MKRFFFSKFAVETNTFSNIPTTLANFELAQGAAVLDDPALRTLSTRLAAEGVELVAGLSAVAEPAAPMQAACHATLRDRLLAELDAQWPVDAVLLHLHGAMVAEQCDDCEGDLLRRIRARVGPRVPIGAMLDPHAHLTSAMVGHADFLAFMKEYPHTDGPERTDAVVRVLLGMLDGSIAPTAAVVDCHMQGFFPTQSSPMREFVAEMRALEDAGDVLDVSFIHGFPFGDTAETGSRLLVYTNGDPGKAQQVGQALEARLRSIRDAAMLSLSTLDDAVAAMRTPGPRPLVIADFADNPGGGAPSDNVTLTRAVIGLGLERVVIGLVCDPEAVKRCREVGIGGTLDLRVGGKTGRASGQPIDLDVVVMGLASNAHIDDGAGARYALGDTAWIRHAGVDIALSSQRMQLMHPSGLTHLGIEPGAYDVIIVKSSNHFVAGFGPIAGRIMHVAVEGALDTNLLRIPYRKLQSRWYPKDDVEADAAVVP